MFEAPRRREETERFVAAAQAETLGATFEDLFAFLPIRRVAPGSAHARFKETFGEGESGRKALIAELKRTAVENPRPSPGETVDLMELVNDIRDRDPDVGDRIRQIALDEFDRYSGDGDQALRANELIRMLMIAVAASEEDSRRLLRRRYATADATYAQRYRELLNALGRDPIPQIGSADNLAYVLGAVLDGFLVRAALENDDAANGSRARELFAAVLIPLVGALSHSQGSSPPPETSRLYADLMPSATAEFKRTPGWAVAAETPCSLRGTWRGTMLTDVVTRDPHLGHGPRETYLVIDANGDHLQISNFIATGMSRMLFPQLTHIAGRYRLACMYEADLMGNPTPDWPSHRGAWILESDDEVTQLNAVYFNDRSARGRFVFDSRVDQVSGSFFEAQHLIAAEHGEWSSVPTIAMR